MFSISERKYRNIVRIPHEMEVIIDDKGNRRVEKTLDVSKHGLFIITKIKKRVGEYINLTIPLTSPPYEIVATVVVISRVASKEDFLDHKKVDGFGVKFVEMHPDSSEIWDRYVNKLLYEYYNFISSEQLAFQFNLRPERRSTFLVTFPTKNDLVDFFNCKIDKKNLFVYTQNKRPVGDLVDLIIIHPESEKELKLEGEVTDVDIENKLGINVKICKISKDNLEEILRFVNNGA